jgi:subtilisin family serine protease
MRSPRVGKRRPVADSDPADQPRAYIIELNVLYPGGLAAVTRAFFAAWSSSQSANQPAEPVVGQPATAVGGTAVAVPDGLRLITSKLYQAVLTDGALQALLARDRQSAVSGQRAVFKAWPDYTLVPHIDRSAATVQVDAAWRSYSALGKGIVWAVLDSGVDAEHPHFGELELAHDFNPDPNHPAAVGLHRDFTGLVRLDGDPPAPPPSPLTDECGHGTHVSATIAGACPKDLQPWVALNDEPTEDEGFVPREPGGSLSGMAPECEIVSLKVLREDAGNWVTSSAAVIAALEYLRTEVNIDRGLLRVHGVNLSLGCRWDPNHYAAGQSPLCQMIDALTESGVVVVVSSGNGGGTDADGQSGAGSLLGTITEPAHADSCIAVGSTHRDSPHAFGISWTSGKGPTLDGRAKPDLVAPGEWITSAASGALRSRAGLNDPAHPVAKEPPYAPSSGTSMAAAHVSGVLAAFLSARPEFIGRPRQVKKLLCDTATDLGRERYAQGAGLADLMRMLVNS